MAPSDLRGLHEALEIGNVEQVLSGLSTLETGAGVALAFRGGLRLAGHPEGWRLTSEDVERFDGEDRAWLGLFTVFQARLRGDVSSLRRTADLLEGHAQTPASPAPHVARLATAWANAWTGQPQGDLEAFEAEARVGGWGDMTVDFAVLRTLAAMAEGTADGLALARRASRMGQAEHRPQSEYASHIVLARARRRHGHAHLAIRILRGLLTVTPAPWHDWIAYELIMAGVRHELPTASIEPSGRGRAALFDALPGLVGTDSRSLTSLLQQLPAWTHAEVRDAHVLAGNDGISGTTQSRGWVASESHTPPHGLLAFYGVEHALVRVDLAGNARRFLGNPPTEFPLVLPESPEPRTEAAVVALVSSQSMSIEEFFMRVYGFEYDKALHSSWVRTLLMRMRNAVEGVAEIERTDDGVRLIITSPFCVRDGRCQPTPEDRVLKLIAEGSGMSAREAAGKLGVPLRSVQRILKGLTEDGVCVTTKRERAVIYHVEDTTFHEPTTSYRRDIERIS